MADTPEIGPDGEPKRKGPGRRKNSTIATARLQREKNIYRLEEMILRGVTNKMTLAAAFGVSHPTVAKWMSIIEERWKKERRTDIEIDREHRIRQMDTLGSMAIHSFEKSKRDSAAAVVAKMVCEVCSGDCEMLVNGQMQKCEECNGVGIIVVREIHVTGYGDVAYLRVAKECFSEAAKLQGLAPLGAVAMRRTVVASANAVGGVIRTEIEEMFLEADPDTIIQARAAMGRLESSIKSGGKKVEAKVIQPEATDESPGQ